MSPSARPFSSQRRGLRTRSKMTCGLIGIALLIFHFSPGEAVEPKEMLKNPVLEARARQISQGLRCLVCQNQSIDDSNAPLAQDLRVLLRERLQAGDSDAQAVGFLVSRYGNFVLLKPPVQADTLLLWAGPALILLGSILGFGLYLRTRKEPEAPAPEGFTAADEARLSEILQKEKAI